MKITRKKKLLYGFALAGCFLTVMAVDDGPEQEEISEAHKAWVIEQARAEERQKFYGTEPAYINEAEQTGRPDWEKQYAWLRENHRRKK